MTATQLKLALLTLLAMGLFVLQGCSNDTTQSTNTDDEVLNLTDTYGGYQPTSEAPGFGDPEILAMEQSQPAGDSYANSALVDSLRNLVNRDVYSLEILWGKLQFDSSATEITDWSGSLSVERGAIVAARLIRFEPGDHLVRPRPNGQTLEWESQTLGSFDGLLVFVYDPQPDSFDNENTLTLTTAPYSRTFTMGELASIEEVVDVGENQISLTGFQTVPLDCGEGFLEGRWTRLPNERGNFKGHWISSDGYLLGHVQGHFGVDPSGENVLFGKWIGIGGAFRGLLRGTWGADDVDGAQGWFNGRWDNAVGTKVGDFGGSWVSVAPPIGTGDGNGISNGNGDGDGVCDSTGVANGDGTGSSDRAHRVGHGTFRGQWQEVCEGTD